LRAFAQATSGDSTTHENGSTFSFGIFAALLVCAAAFLGIGAPAASAAPAAAPAFEKKASFGSGVCCFFNRVRNPLAVDSHGNVMVVDENQPLIRVLGPDGATLTEFGTPGVYPSDIAVDLSNDALYAQSAGTFSEPTITRRFTSDGNSPPTYTVDPGFEVASGEGIAVDPTTHDLLIAGGGAESIRRYSSAGALLDTIATPGIAPQRIAIAPDGSIYVTQESSTSVYHLSGTGTSLGEIASVGAVTALAIQPTTGRLVASVGNSLKLYSPGGVLLSESPSGDGVGTAFDGSGTLLYELSSTTKGINAYSAVISPGVEPPVVSAITGHSAHLEAEVEPGEGEPGEVPAESKAYFEYSADGLTWTSTPEQSLTVPSTVATVEADITGLLANLAYQVRVVASNAGTKSTSSAVTFSTAEIAPEVETGVAGGLGETGATLNGTVNPNGLQTTYHFEYGTTAAYGSRVPVNVEAVAGNQRSSRSFGRAISGLAPGTTYHYRIVATNSAGETAGADKTFATIAAGKAPARAYEMVTPVDKRGALIANDFHFQEDPRGSALTVSLSAGPSDGESALNRQTYLVRRGADGWTNWINTDPPQAAEGGYFESATFAISEDFTKALVASNRALAPGAIAGGGNVYVRDLNTGAYTFVGGGAGPEAYRRLVSPSVNYQVFAAAAPDFSWILFWSDPPLVPGLVDRGLYRWSLEDGLKLESRLPGGSIPSFPLVVSPIQDTRVRLPVASTDGSLVAFDLNKEFAGGVYVRENEESTAISVSHRAGDDPSAVQAGILEWVVPSGRYVFFTSGAQLTEDTPPTGEPFLYRYDTETGDLLYILSQVVGSGPPAVLHVTDDGQTVYIRENGRVVAWKAGELDTVTPPGLPIATATYATDDGRYFAWVGDDNEAHLYDLEADESVCVSCPVGGASLGGAHFVSSGRATGNRSPRGVLEDGTIFFDTPNPLLPADHNGKRDVYSYKDGKLTLISPGDADVDARFNAVSADGTDVYFETTQGILPQDVDRAMDVYDARVGGGFPQPPTKTPCSGEGCRGPIGTAPQGPTISSSGSGRSARPAVTVLKSLTSSDRTKLAKGKKANLRVQVSRAGKLEAIGKASVGRVISASVQAKHPGAVSIPIRLNRKGLTELNRKGSLAIRLTVSLGDEGQKVVSVTLKSAGPNKGGRS
jgi:hypothetical protein